MEALVEADHQEEVDEACQDDDQGGDPAQIDQQLPGPFFLWECQDSPLFVRFVDIPGWGEYISSKKHQLFGKLPVTQTG